MSPSNLNTFNEYGQGDATYRAAGELDGITCLVDAFYQRMDQLPEAKTIRDMHPKDLTLSRKKLAFFLSGWMGGPKLYREHFGPISIPRAHCHLPIDTAGRDAWLLCMEKALTDLEYPETFKNYLIKQLSVPAESIRLMCDHYKKP